EERVHLLFELALAHLSVRDEEAKIRRELLQLLGSLLDCLDAVVEVESLPFSLDLALERLGDQFFVVLAHRRADRTTSLRRGLDDRDVAQTGEGHMQRA